VSKGPETRFYTAVHKRLDKRVYREKMHNPYHGGTPDVWYSGNADDLWVEYKWLAKLPRSAPVVLSRLLSPLQQRWLDQRHAEGRNVAVVLGTPEGAWIMSGKMWKLDIDPADIRAANKSKQNVAEYIERRTLLHDVLANPSHTDIRTDLSSIADDDDDGVSDTRGAK
jgi:hypothetical protein